MEINRPLSGTKWVSRRALDSQATHRDHGAGAPQHHGRDAPHMPNIENRVSSLNHNGNKGNNSSFERVQYGASLSPGAAAPGRGGGGAGSVAVRANSAVVPQNTDGNGGNRFSFSFMNANNSCGAVAPNATGAPGKLHHVNGYGVKNVNNFGHHGSNSNGGSGNPRWGYGGGGGSCSELVEPTMPPPPRSVQMGHGILSAQGAAMVPRDLVPPPRRAKAGGGAINVHSLSPKPMERGGVPSPLTSATVNGAPNNKNHNSGGAGGPKRWAANPATPAPRSATAKTTNPATVAATHFDAQHPLPAPKSSTVSPLFTLAKTKAVVTVPSSSVVTRLPRGAGPAILLNPVASTIPRSFPAALDASPVETYHLVDNLSSGPSAFGGSLPSQPSEIEALLAQVERSASAALSLGAPGERATDDSLRQRRSMTDRGIEEAIRSVLPGIDEDENSDDVRSPNLLTGHVAAIAGDWHTCGETDKHPLLNGNAGGVEGFHADFPTTFSTSSEPASALLPTSSNLDAASSTMDNLSRAFSTAARAESTSLTASSAPATTPPQPHCPISPDAWPSHHITPMETGTNPLPTRSSIQLNNIVTTQAVQTALPHSFKSESSMHADDEPAGCTFADGADLFVLYNKSPPTASFPWLSSGTGEASALMLPMGYAVDDAAAAAMEGRSPPVMAGRPEGLQTNHMKELGVSGCGGGSPSVAGANGPSAIHIRQSITSSHGGSAPNTPSIRKDMSTPMSGSRSQLYTPGGSRHQRPLLSAPVVNRDTIAHIFRETPQSLRRKERMELNHLHHPQALCKDRSWPPQNEVEVEQLLRGRSATKLLRHLTIISFSRQHVRGVQELFDTWAKNGIPAPDMGFGAYYFYVKEKSEKQLCMKHNGRGASPGHGYGRCDFESRRPYSTCRYEHVCLFCRSKDHGWFEEGKCQGYQQLLAEMEDLGVNEEDVVTLLDAMEKTGRSTWSRS